LAQDGVDIDVVTLSSRRQARWGKELAALAINDDGDRRAEPLVAWRKNRL
jgi:hypothetical protein